MTTETQQTPETFKAGYVALIGKPNVGKSTLMNQFLKQKIAIVSRRPQTTRHRILGILSGDDYQIIFQDTPGIIQPKYELQKTMVQTAQKGISEADVILMMVDAKRIEEDDEAVITSVKSIKKPVCLIINKVDSVAKGTILPIIDKYKDAKEFKEIVPISALSGDGTDDLLKVILKYLPVGFPFYPPEMISNEPERFFVSEFIREQIFVNFGEEVPYSTTVQVEDFTERPGKKDYILASIIVERDSQKGILIGKGGYALKRVGQEARKEIEAFLDRPVYLQLQVRVKKKWRRDATWVKRFGY